MPLGPAAVSHSRRLPAALGYPGSWRRGEFSSSVAPVHFFAAQPRVPCLELSALLVSTFKLARPHTRSARAPRGRARSARNGSQILSTKFDQGALAGVRPGPVSGLCAYIYRPCSLLNLKDLGFISFRSDSWHTSHTRPGGDSVQGFGPGRFDLLLPAGLH